MSKPNRGAAALRAQTRANLARATDGVKQQQQETQQLRAAMRSSWPHLPLEVLHPDPGNPRKTEDRAADRELKAAILAAGRLELPLTIHHVDGVGWMIKHGHRRYQALRELVEEGHDAFRAVPVFIDTPSRPGPDGERALRIAQVMENNARQGLCALDSAEQYHLVATAGGGEPLSARQVAALSGVEERTMQRYFFLVEHLAAEERAALRSGFPDAGITALYALAEWMREHGARLSPAQRREAVRLFVQERPRPKMVALVLRSAAPRRPAGRPARKRFQLGRTAGGAFQVKLTLPAALVHDPAALRAARRDLERALAQLEALEGGSETDGEG